jgi:two-component system, LytTR family, response regulator
MLIMKVIIIEDEKPAAEKLQKYLLQAGPDIEVAAVLGSVQESVAWLRQHPAPDLVLMDIELSDGLSFRIFEQAPLSSPVIFTTAYDEYWQEAFEHNSIDYLLKPLKPVRQPAPPFCRKFSAVTAMAPAAGGF